MAEKIDFVIPWVDGSDPEWAADFARWRSACTPTCDVGIGNVGRGADGTGSGSTGVDADGGAGNTRGGYADGDTAGGIDLPDGRDVAGNVDSAGGEHTGGASVRSGDCTCGSAEQPVGAIDASVERYRDWDLLRYWFRGVEKFAPWVDRVHFITWGHLPSWLDTANPRLNVVRHEDFIPRQWLPTFSGIPIELNMHRIEGLADRFVYFNDDTFLLRPVAPERFFRKGLPVDIARLNVIGGERVEHITMECVKVINRRHDKRKAMRRNPGKWFNRHYTPGDIAKTMTLMPWSFFPGFRVHHMPQPFLRSTFEMLWAEERAVLEASCAHRFRALNDVSQWLMRFEQLATGRFAPHGYRDTRQTQLSESSVGAIADMIGNRRYTMICLNDNNEIGDYAGVRAQLQDAFDRILGEKSSFEK